MHKKLLSATLLSIFLLTFAFSTVFAQVEGPKEGCTITEDMEAGEWKTWKTGTPAVFQLARDNNNNGQWESTELISSGVFPATIGGVTVRDANKIIIPQLAQADGSGNFSDIERGDTLPTSWAIFCLINTIDTVVDWIFTLLLIVAVALIVVAGFMWITAGSSPESQKKAGNMIKAAVIGIVIAILARVIPALIVGVLT